jgi:hypothetical protein
MQVLSMVWGILALIGMVVGFFPCLGSLNWLTIPFAGVGFIISLIALIVTKEGSKSGSIVGLIGCGVAVIFGIVRLVLGGGVL